MRLAASEYECLDLWAHSFLRDVPLEDAFVLDLPGGGKGRTMNDMRAVYVKPVSRFTSLYMAMIKPFRHWIVYPAMLRVIKKAWIHKYGGT